MAKAPAREDGVYPQRCPEADIVRQDAEIHARGVDPAHLVAIITMMQFISER